jgi:hypothetical protein
MSEGNNGGPQPAKLILEIAELIGAEGLSVAQADLVLGEVAKLIRVGTAFDLTSPAFHAEVAAYNEQFGQTHPLRRRQ